MRGRYQPDQREVWQEQDALSWFAHFEQGGRFEPDSEEGRRPASSWYLQATWDGAVAAAVALSPEDVADLTDFVEVLKPAWKAVVSLVEQLGGYGPAQLAVAVFAAPDLPPSMPLMRNGASVQRPPPPKHRPYSQLPELTLIGRWVSVADPTVDMLGSVDRELQRAAGRHAPEPERPASSGDATE